MGLVSNKHISSISLMKCRYVGGKYLNFITANSGDGCGLAAGQRFSGNSEMAGGAVGTTLSKGARLCQSFEPAFTVAMSEAQFPFQSFSNYSNLHQSFNSNQMPSRGPKIFKLCEVLDLNMMNNFPHWPDLKFRLDFMS
jgi:hypothetical protein